MAFAQRIIKLQFQLGAGDFGGGNDTVDIEGLRCSASIVREGVGFARADLQVWGMPLSTMNKLTVLQKTLYEQQKLNRVIISAGDEDSGVSTCFAGVVREAWADGRQQPDVMFHVSADSALYDTLKPVPPVSFKGTVDVAVVLAGIASQMGYGFENSGVTGQINNPYWPGTPKAQIAAVCEAVNCQSHLDDANKVLAVWPNGKARDGAEILLSKDSGMVGYPAFTQSGIKATSLYNPSFEFGRKVRVESDFKPANGSWVINALAHRLESLVPGGMWFSDIECSTLGFSE